MSSLAIEVSADTTRAIANLAKLRAEMAEQSKSLREMTQAQRASGSDELSAGQLQAAEAVGRTQAAMRAATRATKSASEEMGHLNFATSGAIREFVVLGHEIMTGRFNRIPGSLVVMSERMGGLHAAIEAITPTMIGAGAAALALAGAMVAIASSAYRAEEAFESAQGVFTFRNFAGTDLQIRSITDSLSNMAGQSSKDIGETTSALADLDKGTAVTGKAIVDLAEKAAQNVPGISVAAATKNIVSSLNDLGTKGLETLQHNLHASAATVLDFNNALHDSGDKAAASAILLKAYRDQVDKVAQRRKPETIQSLDLYGGVVGANPVTSGALTQGMQAKAAQQDVDDLKAALQELGNVNVAGRIPLEDVRTKLAAMAQDVSRTHAQILAEQRAYLQQRVKLGFDDAKQEGQAQRQLATLTSESERAASQSAIEAAHEQTSAIAANARMTAGQRLASERGVWAALLAGDKLTADDRMAAARDLNEVTTRFNAQGVSDAKKSAEEQLAELRSTADEAERGSEAKIAAAHAEAAFAEKAFGAKSTQAVESEKRVTEAVKEETAQRKAIAREEAEGDVQLSLQKIDAAKSALQAEVDAGKITVQEKLAQEAQLMRQEESLNEQTLQAARSAYAQGTVDYARYTTEIRLLRAKLNSGLDALNLQSAADAKHTLTGQARDWQSMFNQVDSAAKSAFDGMLSGHETMARAMAQAGKKLAESWIEDLGEMTIKLVAFEAARAALGAKSSITQALNPFAGGGTQAGGMVGLLSDMLKGTSFGKTLGIGGSVTGAAATVGGASQSGVTAANTAAITTNTIAVNAHAGVTTISGAATSANTVGLAGQTVASGAQATATAANTTTGLIPMLGAMASNTAALLESAVKSIGSGISSLAGEAASGFSGVASLVGMVFAEGTDGVPQTGLALVHQGEIIIPAAQSAMLRSGGAGLSSGSFNARGAGLSAATGSGSPATATAAITIKALDSKSVVTALRNPYTLRSLTRGMTGQLNNNPSLRPAY